jgi:preprotein translocase subunit YajC
MISTAYAMAAPPAGSGAQPNALSSMLMPMLVVFAIFYFVALRPQRKRDVAHRKFLSELKKGDEVVTQSGLYGRIAGLTDNVVTLEVAQNIKIRVSKSTIAGLQPKEA